MLIRISFALRRPAGTIRRRSDWAIRPWPLPGHGRYTSPNTSTDEYHDLHHYTTCIVRLLCSAPCPGAPHVVYPKLPFTPAAFVGVGCPLGMVLPARGTSQLGAGFRLTACPSVVNVMRRGDPLALRLEPLLCMSTCSHRRAPYVFNLNLTASTSQHSAQELVGVRPLVVPKAEGQDATVTAQASAIISKVKSSWMSYLQTDATAMQRRDRFV